MRGLEQKENKSLATRDCGTNESHHLPIGRLRDLQRAGIATLAAEELLGRMQGKVDGLCGERDRLIGEQRRKYPGTNKVINGPIERRFR